MKRTEGCLGNWPPSQTISPESGEKGRHEEFDGNVVETSFETRELRALPRQLVRNVTTLPRPLRHLVLSARFGIKLYVPPPPSF